MPKLNARTLSIMSGLLLSTALPACGQRQPLLDKPAPVPAAVVVKDTPPAELTKCADRPAGLPEDKALMAQIPTPVRSAIIRIARAFATNAGQLDRLINWTVPATCPVTK